MAGILKAGGRHKENTKENTKYDLSGVPLTCAGRPLKKTSVDVRANGRFILSGVLGIPALVAGGEVPRLSSLENEE